MTQSMLHSNSDVNRSKAAEFHSLQRANLQDLQQDAYLLYVQCTAVKLLSSFFFCAAADQARFAFADDS